MITNHYQETLARILRVDQHTLIRLEENLERLTGKKGVLEKIAEENEKVINEKLAELGVRRDAFAHEIFDALISKIEADDVKIFQHLELAKVRGQAAAQKIVDFVTDIHPPKRGFFLKKAKAKELLLNQPPKNIMKALGYTDVKEMVEKEDLEEIFSALRFLEEREWQNKVFFRQYETLTPDDFEERELEVRALHEKWAKAAEEFVAKKYHNVSHLKELGVIFVIPIFLGISGESFRLLSLLFHYLYEVKYYAELFQGYAKDPSTFAEKIISLLRGDVVEERLPPQEDTTKPRFLVVQRYLAKEDENDWRLFEPRINPEALHWQRAEHDMVKINRVINFEDGLDFWRDTDWIGGFFKTDAGPALLVSFDLVDTVMALVKKKELMKYLYHHQEALWNKIIVEYFGVEKLEEMTKEHILGGWFEI